MLGAQTEIMLKRIEIILSCENIETHTKFLLPPISRCTCEAGRFACSHILTVLLIFKEIQNLPNDIDWNKILIYFPMRIKLGSSILVPSSLLFSAEI